jgi:hypothetical protein
MIMPALYCKKITAIAFLLLLSTFCFAQNKAVVKGRVLDSTSKAPVEFATIALVNATDTALISYTVTQKDGAFNLSGLPTGIDTRLIISTMGYNPYRKLLVLKPGEIRDIGDLYLNNKVLNEVQIKGERAPVIQKRDTLEFNAEAFKTRPNAVVEDLLRLLPGIQVNVDGSILVNGRKVSKMLIDGKRFFGSDPTVASKNLDADMVSAVQVYDDREEDPNHRLSDFEVDKIINLKLKRKVRKSTLGKVYGGVGTRGRYEGGGIISSFRDTLQVSVLGLSNNLTRTGFSSSELYSMGGFNRSGGDHQYDGTFGGNGDGGIEHMWSGGFSINNDYGKKLKTNLMYFYSNYKKDYDKTLLTDQKLGQTSLFTLDKSVSQIWFQRHSTSTLLEWVPDTVQRIRLDARLDIMPNGFDAHGLTATSNAEIPHITDLLNRTHKSGMANEFTDNLFYYRKLRKPGASFTLGQTFYVNTQQMDEFDYNDLTSYTSAVNSSLLDRYLNSGLNTYRAGLTATLNTPLSQKVSNEVFIQSRYQSATNKLSTFDKDAAGNYNIFLDDQSNNLSRNNFIQDVQNTVNFKASQSITLKAGLNLETQAITNSFNGSVPGNSKSYTYLLPVFKLTQNNRFELNYNELIAQPDIAQMQPITRQISPVETLTGNPGLMPNHKRNLNFGYQRYNNDKQTFVGIAGNLTITGNNVVQVSTKDTNGFITSTFINKNSGWNAGFELRRGKQFKKSRTWLFSLNNGLSGTYDQRSFFFNGDGGVQYNYTLTAAQNISINYKSVITLNTFYFIRESVTNYSGVNYPSVHMLQQRVQTIASVQWPDNFIFDAQYQYDYNPQIAAGFPRSTNVLNLAETIMLFKQNRGQVKFSVYDLFNQNTNTYRYASNNSVTSGEQQILKRYFLVTLQYKITSHK